MKHALTILLVLSQAQLVAQQPIPLHNGQQVFLRGKLTMEPAGRLQFVTVKTTAAYLPMVPSAGHKEHPAETVHEVGLSGYNRYDLLYRHRGEEVIVTGKMMTDSASPYYFHSTSLSTSSIRLKDGTELIGNPREKTRLAADLGEYHTAVLLPADLAQPWEYSAHGSPDPERRFLSCGSNGGGDVVNCYCADGFHARHVESIRKGTSTKGAIVLDGMAQVEVGDGAVGSPLQITVTCSR